MFVQMGVILSVIRPHAYAIILNVSIMHFHSPEFILAVSISLHDNSCKIVLHVTFRP